MQQLRVLAVGAASMVIASSAMALTPFTETFSYVDGDLTTVSGGLWARHSSTGTNPVQVTSGAAYIQNVGSAEDVSRGFGALGAGETVYASFNFTVTGSDATTYFAHFKTAGTFFTSRVFVTPAQSGGDYRVGFDTSSTVGNFWSSDFQFGDTHLAVISYNFDTGEARVWLDPVSEVSPFLSEVGFSGDAMEAFAMRQSSGGSTVQMDNVRVGPTFTTVIPSPGSLALIGIGGLVVSRRRRA